MNNEHNGDLIGSGSEMTKLRDEIDHFAQSDAKILITGETGVGKELVARRIYKYSRRAQRPFVAVNCAGIPETLLESELFGHVKGSFTGAHRDRPGQFEVADQGTVFLDEIGEMTPRMQGLLLRFLETGELQKVGLDHGSRPVDVRVVSATNRSLTEMVTQGTFREDLFYRLNVIRIDVPPLRQRKEDLPPHDDVEFCFLTKDKVHSLSQDSTNGLEPSWADRMSSRGDLCFAAFANNRLAGYVWVAFDQVDAENNRGESLLTGVVISFPESICFMYKGFVHREFRGRQIYGRLMSRALTALARRKIAHMLSTADWTNFSAHKSCYRIGFRYLGLIWRFGSPRRIFTVTPKSARAMGIRFANDSGDTAPVTSNDPGLKLDASA